MRNIKTGAACESTDNVTSRLRQSIVDLFSARPAILATEDVERGMSLSVTADPHFMRMAIALATENVTAGKGGPFGAVVVREGQVLAAEANTVTSTNDPTAHAEVNAIRAACTLLGSFQLDGCDVYTSCEPCPMCMAALYWSRCRAVFYGNTKADAADAGFDDSFLYDEVKRPLDERRVPFRQLLPEEAKVSFDAWVKCNERIDY